MLSNHLILCHPRLLLHSISPGLLVFTNELALSSGSQSVRASTSASVLPMNTQGWFSLGLTVFDLLAVQGTLTSLLQHHNLKASILQHSAFIWDWEGGSVSGLSPSCWGLLALWCFVSYRNIIFISAFIFTWHSSYVCVLSRFPLFISHVAVDSGPS